MERQQARAVGWLASGLEEICGDAIRTGDDLALLLVAQRISGMPDFREAEILGPDGTVRAHPDPAWLGRRRSGPLDRRAILVQKPTWFRKPEPEFVQPVGGEQRLAVLRLKPDPARLEDPSVWMEAAVAGAGLTGWGISCLAAGLAAGGLARRLGRAAKQLEEDRPPGLVGIAEADRLIAAAGDRLNRLVRRAEHLEERIGAAEKLHRLQMGALLEADAGKAECWLFADEDHRVVFCRKEAAEKLCGGDNGDPAGHHLLDIFRNSSVLAAWKHGLKFPGAPVPVEGETNPPLVLRVIPAEHGRPAGTLLFAGRPETMENLNEKG